jgi:homocysteine S-methyltransferase
MLGCAGDAYRPETGLPEKEATDFHRPQTQALAAAGADCLLAATLPHLGEARGIARVMAACGIPYLLSFIVRPDGALLDGTPLGEAVASIDTAIAPAPLCYLVNCVHPRHFESAMQSQGDRRMVRDRVIGLQANASARSPEELDGSACLDADPPEVLADAMLRLHRRFGTKILGGCCGTDDRHIAWIARRAKTIERPIV